MSLMIGRAQEWLGRLKSAAATAAPKTQEGY